MAAEGERSQAGLYTLILLMVLMWSGNYVAGKLALRELPALLLVGLRMLLAGMLMIPVYAVQRYRTGEAGFKRSDIPLLAVQGIFGVGLNQFFFVMGLSRTSVAHAAIMIGLMPMLVLLIAAAVGQEKVSAVRLTGLGIALSGVAVIQLSKSGGRSASLTGDLLILAGALAFAVFTVTGKATMGRAGAVVVNTFAYVGTALALLPITIVDSANFAFGQLSFTAWSSLIYMAAFPSVAAYLIFYYALSKVSASKLSAFAYLQPLFATLMAIPALGEYPSSSLILGGILVLAGVSIAERL